MKSTSTAGGTVHPSPFVGPTNYPAAVRVDASALGTDEVDQFGFLKPGVILTRDGLLAKTSAFMVTGATLAIGTTTDEYSFLAFTASIDGWQFSVALDATKTLTAAHIVSLDKFGVILVQSTIAGVVTTKVALATQAYDTAAEALDAALAEGPDAGNVIIGHITIQADGTQWLGDTDDFVDGSDLDFAVFVQAALETRHGNALRGRLTRRRQSLPPETH
ncbi:MAG: hypothetical protein IIB16_04125 [Chloroflexi bacterium]|nr:hypothetical protein [Chloroflexota bacterium]